jgi:hypothetical protein
LVAHRIELVGGDAYRNCLRGDAQDFGRHSTGDPHPLYDVGALDQWFVHL